jgi:hypothetical protein
MDIRLGMSVSISDLKAAVFAPILVSESIAIEMEAKMAIIVTTIMSSKIVNPDLNFE